MEDVRINTTAGTQAAARASRAPSQLAVRNLAYAQFSFFLCLAVTIAHNRAALANNTGLSYYGEHLDTGILFGLGFILCALFMIRAANILSRWQSDRVLWWFHILLWSLAIMLIAILMMPYGKSAWLNMAHHVASMALFATEFCMAGWLVYVLHDQLVMWLLFSGQLLSGIVAFLSVYKFASYLGQSSLVYQLFFGVLLVLALRALTARQAPAQSMLA